MKTYTWKKLLNLAKLTKTRSFPWEIKLIEFFHIQDHGTDRGTSTVAAFRKRPQNTGFISRYSECFETIGREGVMGGWRDLWIHEWKEGGMDASMHACMHACGWVGGWVDAWMDGWISQCCAVLLVWLNMSRNLKCPCSVINNASSLTLTISWVLSLLLAAGKLWAMIQRKCWCITKAHFLNTVCSRGMRI